MLVLNVIPDVMLNKKKQHTELLYVSEWWLILSQYLPLVWMQHILYIKNGDDFIQSSRLFCCSLFFTYFILSFWSLVIISLTWWSDFLSSLLLTPSQNDAELWQRDESCWWRCLRLSSLNSVDASLWRKLNLSANAWWSKMSVGFFLSCPGCPWVKDKQ